LHEICDSDGYLIYFDNEKDHERDYLGLRFMAGNNSRCELSNDKKTITIYKYLPPEFERKIVDVRNDEPVNVDVSFFKKENWENDFYDPEYQYFDFNFDLPKEFPLVFQLVERSRLQFEKGKNKI